MHGEGYEIAEGVFLQETEDDPDDVEEAGIGVIFDIENGEATVEIIWETTDGIIEATFVTNKIQLEMRREEMLLVNVQTDVFFSIMGLDAETYEPMEYTYHIRIEVGADEGKIMSINQSKILCLYRLMRQS